MSLWVKSLYWSFFMARKQRILYLFAGALKGLTAVQSFQEFRLIFVLLFFCCWSFTLRLHNFACWIIFGWQKCNYKQRSSTEGKHNKLNKTKSWLVLVLSNQQNQLLTSIGFVQLESNWAPLTFLVKLATLFTMQEKSWPYAEGVNRVA